MFEQIRKARLKDTADIVSRVCFPLSNFRKSRYK
nr:MAG TPA: hypothetical protein [Caudoviricetes sp.]